MVEEGPLRYEEDRETDRDLALQEALTIGDLPRRGERTGELTCLRGRVGAGERG